MRDNKSAGVAAVRCRHLRTKKSYLAAERIREDSGLPGSTDVYWCLKTLRVSGPDDGLATPQDCVPSRECFER